jgi:hypothetical protein
MGQAEAHRSFPWSLSLEMTIELLGVLQHGGRALDSQRGDVGSPVLPREGDPVYGLLAPRHRCQRCGSESACRSTTLRIWEASRSKAASDASSTPVGMTAI